MSFLGYLGNMLGLLLILAIFKFFEKAPPGDDPSVSRAKHTLGCLFFIFLCILTLSMCAGGIRP